MSKIVNLTPSELKESLRYIINNNRILQSNMKKPVSVNIVADAGLGKTSIALDIANEMGLHYVKLNLSQIEEIGDLVGFPIRQFELVDNKDLLWIDEHATEEYIKRGYSFTGRNRMSYCPPEWISGKENGGILLLDDWTRADVRYIQAIMELIDRQEYISWKLPKDWHIILTSNPDDGDYSVNSIDPAQKTRFISFGLKFETKEWAEWAEKEGIDGRCINFLLMHPEVIDSKKGVNARSITTFFNCLSSMEDFEKNLPLIQIIGEGSVGPEVSTLFTSFIKSRMDKMISPEEILLGTDTKEIIKRLKNLFGKMGNSYRADIASVIATRIINYSLKYAESNKITDEMIQRMTDIVVDDEIFTNDINYHIIKKLTVNNKSFAKMIQNKTVQHYALK